MAQEAKQQLLEAVRGRKTGGRFGYGLTTADNYAKSVVNADCERFKIGDADAFLKEAANRLTYCAEDMTFGKTYSSGHWKQVLPGNVAETLEKSVKSKVAMVFKNIVTTTREDRDRDVLKTAGAEVDPKMPFLWQHIHTLPLGKMLMVDEHTDDMLKVWTVLFDMNELTKDAAVLIENDALRISHGFIPKQIQDRPYRKGDTDERMPGFDIMKFEIMEESGVSVPSNVDAVIELYGTEKLASPEMKSWAKSFFDGRQKTTNVGYDEVKAEGMEAIVHGLKIIGEGARQKEHQAGGGNQFRDQKDPPSKHAPQDNAVESDDGEKDVDTVTKDGRMRYERTMQDGTVRKGMYVEIKGSYEWVRKSLRGKPLKEKMSDVLGTEDFSVYPEATFSDHLIVEVYNWDTSDESYWQVDYTFDDSGLPKLTGVPVEVDVSSSVQKKEVDMKVSPKQRIALKGFARFLKTLELTDDQKDELDVYGSEFDDILSKNNQPTVFKQSEGGEEENPNSGDGSENPGVEGSATDDGNDANDGESKPADESAASPAAGSSDEGKSVTIKEVTAFLASEKIDTKQKAVLQQMLG